MRRLRDLRERVPRGGLGIVTAVLAAAQLGANCVDGVTPDCSNPAVCAPSTGDIEGGPFPDEASTDTGVDASVDAPAILDGAPDGDADAADADGG